MSASFVSYDERSLRIGSRRELLISGEIHYPRVPEGEWERVLDATKAAGVNCVASYVFWGLHEPAPGEFDFRGQRDLARFVSRCGERGLHVILRAGPYCCAEWNFGGFPAWLRDEPCVEFRTWNAPYLRRTERWLRHLFAETLPLLATRGGPIVLVQLENEYANIAKRYGKDGDRYLAWILELGRDCGIDVPVVMCEGAAEGAVEAFNGFDVPAERIADFRKRRPGLPLLWTEHWPGWYDTWGSARHVRDPRNIAYQILRFLAEGGSGWNYYMWHGGSNFGRTSMYLQTQSYDFGAPLDEWGRLSPKGEYLATLHHLLLGKKDLLLNGARKNQPGQATWKGRTGQLSIAWEEGESRATVSDESGRVLFDTAKGSARLARSAWRRFLTCETWAWSPEPLPAARGDAPILRAEPEDQLLFTKDATDYCWYSHSLTTKAPGPRKLRLTFCGDFLRVYVNGAPVAQTELPLNECRGPTERRRDAAGGDVNPLELSEPQYEQTFRIPLRAGANRIDILCGALGLIKGDWMISGPMTGERKGIWNRVFLDGKPLRGWEIRPGLSAGHGPARRSRFLGWHETTFSVPRRLLGGSHDFRLDLDGWEKGMVFVNGRMLGRHWLVPGDGYGVDGAWHLSHEWGLSCAAPSEPSQRYYRIPDSWLGERNTLTLFEEGVPPQPVQVKIETRKTS
jgi:hypothetical protein